MKKTQELQVKISECRSKVNDLTTKKNKGDEINESDYEYEVRKMSDLETEYRSALEVENKEYQIKEEETADLAGELKLGNYLTSVLNGREIEGREKEFNNEFGLSDMTVPWQAIAPTRQVEMRADAVTSAPSVVGVNQNEFIRRVFARTGAAYLGIDMPSVPVGHAMYPVLTSTIAPKTYAKGTANESLAATFTPKVLKPRRLQASYLFRIEDMAELAGMEEALRDDLSNAMAEQFDKAILSDDGTTGTGLNEVTGFIDSITATDKSSAVVTFNDFIELYADRVDGRYAVSTSDVKVLTGAKLYTKAHTLFETTAVRESAYSYISRIGGGFQVSAHVPEATGKKQNALVVRNMTRAAVAPIWQGLTLIRDPYTGAEKGEIKLSATMLYSFDVLRSDNFANITYKYA